MQDITYLLSIKELLEESTKKELTEIAYKKLDNERRKKAQNITNETKRAESIGAGLLLQLGLQFIQAKSETYGENVPYMDGRLSNKTENASLNSIQHFSISRVLAKLGEPIEAIYEYSENRKPYFRDIPWQFNLSHSREYVLCVFSKQEVGVDIQQKRNGYQERILQRFFTEEELETWQNFPTREEKDAYFYRIWTAKEAYGKLTGEGIAKAISVDTSPETAEKLGVEWKYYDDLAEYAISVCKRKETKHKETNHKE